MAIQGRKFSGSSGYRYGFNGKENDRETVGTGEGTQDYGFRIYNPSLGRFLSVDPIGRKFAYYSPYHFAGNTPIMAIDLEGAEIKNSYYNYDNKGQKTTLKNPDDKVVAEKIDKEIAALHNDDETLFNYINNNYEVNVTNGNVGNTVSDADNIGSERTSFYVTTITPPTFQTAAQKYDAGHGDGSFKQLLLTDESAAAKYYADFKLNPGPDAPIITIKPYAEITIDLVKISKINRQVVSGERQLSGALRTGQVIKHEIGHFLYDILKLKGNVKDGTREENNEASEKKAKEIEKTFDADPATQTDKNDLPK